MSKKYLKQIAFILIYSVFILVILEWISGKVSKAINPHNISGFEFNRSLSGYTVFNNTPDFKYWTYKEGDSGTDVQTDKNGFICDEPVCTKKEPGTVRVFLMGGSAMLGAGQIGLAQGDKYKGIKEFPGALYEYRISIAGFLKKYLQERLPGKKIQVINYACYERRLHQSMLSYLETVHRFQPDIIVNMDGFNDIAGISDGNIYQGLEKDYLDKFVGLHTTIHSFWFRLKSLRLIYYLMMRLKEKEAKLSLHANLNQKEQTTHLALASMQNASPAKQDISDTAICNRAAYNQLKSELVNASGEWLTVLNQYMSLLTGDSVKFIFIMQPMLERGVNKPLANYEQRMANIDFFEEARIRAQKSKSATNTDLYEREIKAYLLLKTTLRYFFDDYLSGEIKQRVEKKGGYYMDANAEMQGLDKKFEFYTDYCHITKNGNRFMAEKIGQLILEKNLIPVEAK